MFQQSRVTYRIKVNGELTEEIFIGSDGACSKWWGMLFFI
jgi:hypothetical protein